MEIKIFETEQQLDAFIGKYMVDYIHQHPSCTLGFATGSTPLGCYDYLKEAYKKGDVDFSQVHAFNLDEYVGIPKTHPRSFSKFMDDYLFNHINIPKDQIDSLDGNSANLEEECLRYENAIDKRPIDLQLLGIGMDGHIAYNEPGSPLDGMCHVVDLFEESISSSLDYGFDEINEVPRQGISQGIGTIMKAKQLVMMAKGEKKAKLVERMLYGEVSSDFPSSIIQKHGNVLVLLDKQAAKYIKKEI